MSTIKVELLFCLKFFVCFAKVLQIGLVWCELSIALRYISVYRSSAGLSEDQESGVARKLRRAMCGSEAFCSNLLTVPTALSAMPLL